MLPVGAGRHSYFFGRHWGGIGTKDFSPGFSHAISRSPSFSRQHQSAALLRPRAGHADPRVPGARWAGDDAYRHPLEVGPGEVPADLLARLSRTDLASSQKGLDGAETALNGARARAARNTKRPKPCDSGRFDW